MEGQLGKAVTQSHTSGGFIGLIEPVHARDGGEVGDGPNPARFGTLQRGRSFRTTSALAQPEILEGFRHLPLTLDLQPIEVMTGHDDRDGRLVLFNGQLVAVLVRLESEFYGDQRGGWFLEAGFGLCTGATPPVFPNLGDAQAWIGKQIAAARLQRADGQSHHISDRGLA